MSFTAAQAEALDAKLDRRAVKSRDQAGRAVSYIESWHAIAEANRIFGFDGWSCETVDVAKVAEAPRRIGRPPKDRDGWGVSYTAKVRVVAGGVTREGVGAGHGIDADLGQAHESAIKEAESDALKRALRTFGNPFGLALYDKKQEGVDRDPAPRQQAPDPAPSIEDDMLASIAAVDAETALDRMISSARWQDAFAPLDTVAKERIRTAIAGRRQQLQQVPA